MKVQRWLFLGICALFFVQPAQCQNDRFDWLLMHQMNVVGINVYCELPEENSLIKVRRYELAHDGSLLLVFHHDGRKVQWTDSIMVDSTGNELYYPYTTTGGVYQYDRNGQLVRENEFEYEYDKQGKRISVMQYLRTYGIPPAVRTVRNYAENGTYVDSTYAIDESGGFVLRECWKFYADDRGHILGQELLFNAVSGQQPDRIDYEYNAVGLLVREEHTARTGGPRRAYLFEYTIRTEAKLLERRRRK